MLPVGLLKYFFNRYSLLLAAFLIILFSIVYTNKMASAIKKQEMEEANELANAYKKLSHTHVNEYELTYLLEKIKKNNRVPIIWTDAQNNIIEYKNFKESDVNADANFLRKQLNKMSNNRIDIILDKDNVQYLYYKDSILLSNIKRYPYYQLFLVIIFFTICFIAFASIRKAEQNFVWVGMAKETAHQLGTPISSLTAWLELLKDKLSDDEGKMITNEMENDIERLHLVANRFSKIGSVPELKQEDILPIIEKIVAYMKLRAAHSIVFQIINTSNGKNIAKVNAQLLEWVLENIIKNALDAMERKGKIIVFISNNEKNIVVDISDTGKGILKKNFNNIFKTGFSTKKRGWGIGLALSKRIIETYHKGSIFIKESEVGKGTTFRIILRR